MWILNCRIAIIGKKCGVLSLYYNSEFLIVWSIGFFMRFMNLARYFFAWFFLAACMFAGGDTLDSFQRSEYNRLGEPYLRYLKAYLEVKYFVDKDLVKARALLPAMYDASYALLTKSPRYLGSYYNAKAHIELQSGNQIAATNSFLISIDYFIQDTQDDGKRLSSELSYEYIDLANVYFSLELYSKAVPYYRNAVAEFRAENDNLGLATSLNNLGLVFEKQGMYDSALVCFTRGLAARKLVKSSDTCYYFGHSLKYMARAMLELKQYDSCLSFLKKAEAYTTATNYYGAKYILVEIYNLYARYYIERGDAAAVKKYFDLAVKTGELHYQNQALCETYRDMANYYFHIHEYQSATRYGEKALTLALSKNFFNERLHALLLLGEINTMTGNKEKAITYIEQYDSLNDARKSFIVESGLDALRESVKNRETIYKTMKSKTDCFNSITKRCC
jgi:tetratricopeptide (TPR) repeat protein